jgi:hypothetical protein
MKTRVELHQKTEEILSKFSLDAKERYKQNALFHQVIQMLVRMDDPYLVIEQLIIVTEDCQNALEHHMLMGK